jgi:hypothetical protein
MRLAVVSVLTALALSACGQSQPPAAPTSSATPAPAAPATPKPADAAPSNTMMAKAPQPEGDCGDQSKLPEDQRVANTAKWSTASEQDSFSFDVFRGDSEKGEFKKITPMPIMGAGTTDETHKYEYRDDTIDPCKEYWYYVESVSTKGAHEKFTPVFHAPAKRRPRGAAADATGH